jgi:hypothetical protein
LKRLRDRTSLRSHFSTLYCTVFFDSLTYNGRRTSKSLISGTTEALLSSCNLNALSPPGETNKQTETPRDEVYPSQSESPPTLPEYCTVLYLSTHHTYECQAILCYVLGTYEDKCMHQRASGMSVMRLRHSLRVGEIPLKLTYGISTGAV